MNTKYYKKTLKILRIWNDNLTYEKLFYAFDYENTCSYTASTCIILCVNKWNLKQYKYLYSPINQLVKFYIKLIQSLLLWSPTLQITAKLPESLLLHFIFCWGIHYCLQWWLARVYALFLYWRLRKIKQAKPKLFLG